MANAKDNPFNRMLGNLPTDIAMVQALTAIGTQLKRIADQGEEKLKNERIAMEYIKEPKFDCAGTEGIRLTAHVHTNTNPQTGQAYACFCPSTVNH